MTAVLWLPDVPQRCACSVAYRPQLNAKGKLVKSREPAWRMMEQTRDPGCLQEQFRALASMYAGVDYQHHGDSRKSGRGYPDVHLWAPGRGSVFVELKRMRHDLVHGRDDPTPAQVARMAGLKRAGHPVYLARPCCLLTGAVDEIIAGLAGVPCRYIKGHPDGPPSPAAILAEILTPTSTAAAAVEAPAAVPVRTGKVGCFVEPVLPGANPVPFPSAVGYVVPMPVDDDAAAAVREVEAWLRGAGFPATTVPFPMRIVVGEGAAIVQVRAGLARQGVDDRVWRGGVPERPFPDHLVQALRAATIAGPSSEKVAWLIEKAPSGSARRNNA